MNICQQNGQPGQNDKFLERYNLPKLNQEESKNLNRWITPIEIEEVIKRKKTPKLPTNKSPGADGFTGEFYQIFQEELKPLLLKLVQKTSRRRKSLNLSLQRPAFS